MYQSNLPKYSGFHTDIVRNGETAYEENLDIGLNKLEVYEDTMFRAVSDAAQWVLKEYGNHELYKSFRRSLLGYMRYANKRLSSNSGINLRFSFLSSNSSESLYTTVYFIKEEDDHGRDS